MTIIDNSQQFDDTKFKNFCSELYIEHWFTSIEHPQSNGEVEDTNQIILQELEKRLDQAKGL